MEQEQGTEVEFDMDAAVEDVAAGLGLSRADDELDEPDAPTEEHEEAPQSGAEVDAQAAAAPIAAPATMNAPQSWAKEQHTTWAGLPPEAQKYIALREKQMLDGLTAAGEHAKLGRSISDAIQPFLPALQQRGMEPAKAVQALLNAQSLLDRDPIAGLRKLAESYNVDLSTIGAETPQDPNLRALMDKVQSFESKITEREQAEQSARLATVASEVEAFAADPANAYFDEVADDIAALMKAYPNLTLKAAYDKAVRANDVTYQKESTRLQAEAEKRALENARLNALKARKATGAVVRSRDTRRSPTEPVGTMNDTMDEVMKSIRSRTH